MAPFIEVPRTVQCRLQYTQALQLVENTLWFTYTGTGSYSLPFLASVLDAWQNLSIRPLQSNSLTFRQIVATDFSSQVSPSITRTIDPLRQGARTDEALANLTSMAVTFRTAGRGRSSRGRNFVLGMTEGQVLGNEVLPTIVQAYIDAYQELNSRVAAQSWSHVVVSFQNNGQPRSVGLAQPVVAYTADNLVDTQRRRKPGRGR